MYMYCISYKIIIYSTKSKITLFYNFRVYEETYNTVKDSQGKSLVFSPKYFVVHFAINVTMIMRKNRICNHTRRTPHTKDVF